MAELAHDEVFCTSCGETIKEAAEICPECGTPQKSEENTAGLSDMRKHELEKIVSKDKTTVILLSIFITPLGYYWIGKTGLAIINFITFNYFLLGWLIVPFHTNKIIEDAKDELRSAGAEGY